MFIMLKYILRMMKLDVALNLHTQKQHPHQGMRPSALHTILLAQ